MKERAFREFAPSVTFLKGFGWALAVLALAFAVLMPRETPKETVMLVAAVAICGLLALVALLAAYRTPIRRIVVNDVGVAQDEPGLHREVSWEDKLVLDEEIFIHEYVVAGLPWPFMQFWCVARLKSPHQEVRFSARVIHGGVDPETLARAPGDNPGFFGVPLSPRGMEDLVEIIQRRIAAQIQESSANRTRS